MLRGRCKQTASLLVPKAAVGCVQCARCRNEMFKTSDSGQLEFSPPGGIL